MEFEFRAWDKYYKNFFDGDLLNDYVLGEIIKDNDLEVTQYSNVKDKNGIKIFTGDIIRKTDTTGYNYSPVGDVVFKDGAFMMKTYEFGITYHYLKTDGYYNDGRSSFDYKIEYEVIGNIYENYELLEQK